MAHKLATDLTYTGGPVTANLSNERLAAQPTGDFDKSLIMYDKMHLYRPMACALNTSQTAESLQLYIF